MSDEAMTPRPDTGLPAPSEATGRTTPADANDDTATDDAVVVDTGAVATAPVGGPLDLDRIERDLAGVESALQRLDDGTYWTDEVTGEAIPEAVLAADPVARRAG